MSSDKLRWIAIGLKFIRKYYTNARKSSPLSRKSSLGRMSINKIIGGFISVGHSRNVPRKVPTKF